MHVFSHFTLKVRVLFAQTKVPVRGRWVRYADAKEEALPSVMQKILRHGLGDV